MILGHSELKKFIKTHNLITGLSKHDLENPTGCIFDLQLDKLYRLKGEAFIGIAERETPEYVEVARYGPKKKSKFTIKPGKYFVTQTIEKINLPYNISALFKPRSTTFRSGLMLRTGIADAGYSGVLYFGLYNAGNVPVTIELGARFACVYFVKHRSSKKNLYKGQWKGGRATTKSREKQI